MNNNEMVEWDFVMIFRAYNIYYLQHHKREK